MIDRLPMRRQDFELQCFGKETVLHDKVSQKIHILNETARFIWERCDGEISLDEIVRQLEETFAVPQGIDTRSLINSLLETFDTKQLLARHQSF